MKKLHVVFKHLHYYIFKEEAEFFIIDQQEGETMEESVKRNFPIINRNTPIGFKEKDGLTLVRVDFKYPKESSFWIAEQSLLREENMRKFDFFLENYYKNPTY